jgi:hypothetical protein
MKTYHGMRTDKGCIVSVADAGNDYVLPLRLDLYNHSPDGFEWGYRGSGPAQLALAILADALKELNTQNIVWLARGYERVAVRLHQDFKDAFIAPLPRDDNPWTIRQEDVLEFVWAGVGAVE